MTRAGGVAIGIALIYFVIVIVKKLFFAGIIEGFTALLFVIILFSGVQLMSLGIIGEYVLRIFFQSKGRPLYVVKEEIIESTVYSSQFTVSKVPPQTMPSTTTQRITDNG